MAILTRWPHAAGEPQSVSAFQAFTISAASRVGVGNIAGAGTAIAVGGPGAVFWMWLMAFIGGASSFIESSLAQLFKTRDRGSFRGGPASNVALTVIVFLLAFSSILGNYYYGESNIEFITRSPGVLTGYRAVVVVAVLAGSVASADLVWNLADGVMGLMALINLVAIALLSPIAFRLLKDYTAQRREGRDPVFTRDRLPGVTGIECWEDELTVTGPIDVPVQRRQDRKHRDHLHSPDER
ncbi:alanine:cation symporter family protein [Microbacterium sp. T2.11-28]|uniref:alanine:cation symporter family protein n=1 Tax=Microbacterium sp. T2.11-28 TaxID=3041169 RepID=UPI002477B59A|nr:alanine:cation symporter family protein [Microbacterium sp. T2.11-28]CAI9391591.1 hypothetical protein MICABA_01820 [Microbacterium sp. T2.11-28]